MAAPIPGPLVDEHRLYPIHEEDDVPEIPLHERQTRYLRDALSARLPDRLVTGNVCICWERDNFNLYVAPDLFVVQGAPPQPLPRVHLTWRDPPILFVAEIGSQSTSQTDERAKLDLYAQHLGAPEYLYVDLSEEGRPLTQEDVRLWRLTPEGYRPVPPGPNGRLHSAQLGLQCGVDESGFLRLYTPEGERLRTYEEAEQHAQEAERRTRELEHQLAALQAEMERRRS